MLSSYRVDPSAPSGGSGSSNGRLVVNDVNDGDGSRGDGGHSASDLEHVWEPWSLSPEFRRDHEMEAQAEALHVPSTRKVLVGGASLSACRLFRKQVFSRRFSRVFAAIFLNIMRDRQFE